MALEDIEVVRKRNKKRLSTIVNLMFTFGINLTAPSLLKDPLRVVSLFIIFTSCMTCYGLVQYGIRYKSDILVIIENVCLFPQTSISVVKLIYLMFVQRRFYRICTQIETHELVDDIPLLRNELSYNKGLRRDAINIMEKCWTTAMRQFYFYLITCTGTVAFYFFRPIIINAYHSIEGNTNHTKMFAFPVLYPAWEDKINQFPYYQSVTIAVGLGNYNAGLYAVAFDGLFIMMTMHGVGLFQILQKIIVFTTHPDVPRKMCMEYVRQCICYAEKCYKFCDEINELYMHIVLVQFIMSLIILGVIMFQAALGLESDFIIFFRMAIYILAAGFQVTIYCLNGQLVTNESNNIPNAWYACRWYDETPEFKRLIHMMILRSNRIVYMRASWFSTMTLSTLLSILKTSASYFLLLRDVAFA